MIEQLALQACRNTTIGSSLDRGVSGGEVGLFLPDVLHAQGGGGHQAAGMSSLSFIDMQGCIAKGKIESFVTCFPIHAQGCCVNPVLLFTDFLLAALGAVSTMTHTSAAVTPAVCKCMQSILANTCHLCMEHRLLPDLTQHTLQQIATMHNLAFLDAAVKAHQCWDCSGGQPSSAFLG